MTKSSHSGIIKHAEVDGVVFCGPGGKLQSKEEIDRQEEENLKALEEFWLSKGVQEGQKSGFEEGLQEGEKRGYQQGHQAGLTEGREEGDKAGYARGLEDGREEGRKEFAEAAQLMRTLVDEMGEERKLLLDKSRQEIVAFCMDVCENLLRRELKDPDSFKHLLEEVLDVVRPVSKEGPVEVFVAPDDYSLLSERLGSLNVSPSLLERIQLHSEKGMLQGNCRVEASSGLVNFDVARHLRELETRVLEVGGTSPLEAPPELQDTEQGEVNDTTGSE